MKIEKESILPGQCRLFGDGLSFFFPNSKFERALSALFIGIGVY